MRSDESDVVRQGSAEPWQERLPLPATAAMDPAQREAAAQLIAGPRKGVYGPFVPLLRHPQLLERVGKVGESLRFEGVLDARVRELVSCAVARHVSNQFEWLMHAPLAVKAGVTAATVEALRVGARPRGLPPDEEAALDFSTELLQRNGVSEPAWTEAQALFGERGVVELTVLVGYFVMVSWLMNAAHTPAQAGAQGTPLPAFPL
jgi:4-carboxymuconolactone decarboxylase